MKYFLFIFLIFIGWHTSASAVDLAGQTVILSGQDFLKVNGCCKDKDVFNLTVTFGINDWIAVDNSKDTYSGTYTANAKGNQFIIKVDDTSKQIFNSELESWASDITEKDISIINSKYSFKLIVNNSLKAKLIGKINLKGTDGISSGTGNYKIIAKGDVLRNISQCTQQEF